MAGLARNGGCNNSQLEDSGTDMSMSQLSFLKNCSTQSIKRFEVENETLLSDSTTLSLTKAFSMLNVAQVSSQSIFSCSSESESSDKLTLSFASNPSNELEVDMLECVFDDQKRTMLFGRGQSKLNNNLFDKFSSVCSNEPCLLENGEVSMSDNEVPLKSLAGSVSNEIGTKVSVNVIFNETEDTGIKNSLKRQSNDSVDHKTTDKKQIKLKEIYAESCDENEEMISKLDEEVINTEIKRSKSRCFVYMKETPSEKSLQNDTNNCNGTIEKKKSIYKTFFRKPATVVPDCCKDTKVIRWPCKQRISGKVVPPSCWTDKEPELGLEAVRRSERLTRSLLAGEPRKWPYIPLFSTRSRRRTMAYRWRSSLVPSPDLGRFNKSIRPRLRPALLDAIHTPYSIQYSQQELATTLAELGVVDTILSFYQFLMVYTPLQYQKKTLPLKGFFNCTLPIRQTTISEPLINLSARNLCF